MPERSEIRLLCSDIDEAVERILQYTSKTTYSEFIDDIRTQDAVIRNLEILGEAVKNLPPDLRSGTRRSHGGSSRVCGTNSSITTLASVSRSSGRQCSPTYLCSGSG